MVNGVEAERECAPGTAFDVNLCACGVIVKGAPDNSMYTLYANIRVLVLKKQGGGTRKRVARKEPDDTTHLNLQSKALTRPV